jgi:hypothetical protein
MIPAWDYGRHVKSLDATLKRFEKNLRVFYDHQSKHYPF